MEHENIRSVFFGTPELAVVVLEELFKVGIIPSVVVTRPDKPKGRGKILTSPPAKIWAEENKVEVLQPIKIRGEFLKKIQKKKWDIFIVAAYGKILPKELLAITGHGTLNMHPSLLPRLRGPSPIRSAILEDEKETGVTIMLMDEEMDHGPILAQEKVSLENWPPRAPELEKVLAKKGGAILAKVIPKWIAGNIKEQEQDHNAATYCSFLKKEDAEINMKNDAYANLLKIRAYEGWHNAFTYFERSGKRIRVAITRAHIGERGELIIERVIPEGKREMNYLAFLQSGAKPV